MTHAPGAIQALVRFTENHDTVAAPELFGAGPSQALTALQALLPGVLLLYQEQEIGFGPELRRLLTLRHSLPELRAGSADYESITADDPSVLVFTRAIEEGSSIAAVSFSDQVSRCRLRVSGDLASRLPVCSDAFSGEAVDLGEPLVIAPYRARVLTLRKEGLEGPRSPESAEGLGRAQTADARETPLHTEELPDGSVRYTVRPGPAERWYVRTPEGLLSDEFVDRHRGTRPGETHVEATLPLARCWRPMEHGLWDGVGDKCVGVALPGGECVEVRVTNPVAVRRARLEDPSSVGADVSLVIDAAPGPQPFEVLRHRDVSARLETLAMLPCASSSSGISIDAQWVRVGNEHYSLVLSRRHGGTIAGLWRRGEAQSLVRAGAEVYTDWGLFSKGQHVGSEWETDPRLKVERVGEATEISFRGRLRIPSWNGVQTGPPAGPVVEYRVTYTVDATATIGITFGATPGTDRPDTSAFLAYRIPFAQVDTWQAEGGAEIVRGVTGQRRGERVFEASGLPDMDRVRVSLCGGGLETVIHGLTGAPTMPDNPFLLDDGAGGIQLFFALLAGTKTDLAAGQERVGGLRLSVR